MQRTERGLWQIWMKRQVKKQVLHLKKGEFRESGSSEKDWNMFGVFFVM
jgi:hypothetical protein